MPQHDPHHLLSIADMARHFALPESSIRYYCKRFEPFLSSVGDGRKRRFHAQAIDIIQAILEQMPKVRTAKAVETYLAAHYPQTVIADAVMSSVTPDSASTERTAEMFATSSHNAPCGLGQPLQNIDIALQTDTNPDQLPQLAMHILNRQTQALDTIATSLDALVKRQESIDALAQRAEKAEGEAQDLREELQTLRLLLSSSEKTQQADLEQIRTWVGKILRGRKS